MAPDGAAPGRKTLHVLAGIVVSFVLVVVAFASAVPSDAPSTLPVVDPYLQEILPTADPGVPILIILSFWQSKDRALLDRLAPHYKFRVLPMASATLTPAQVFELTSWTAIRSIWYGHHASPIFLAQGRAFDRDDPIQIAIFVSTP